LVIGYSLAVSEEYNPYQSFANYKKQIKGLWERFSTAILNAAAASRFRYNIFKGNLGFVYSRILFFIYR